LPVPDLNYGVADAALFLLFLASTNSDFWTKIWLNALEDNLVYSSRAYVI